ncbi:MAG: hypothetical protein ACXQTL_05985 [Methanosarcinales archaeon]
MMFTEIELVRDVSGLRENEVSDDVLRRLIERAEREILRDITVEVKYGSLSGRINGSNATFYTQYAPIADSNFDGVVNTSDVTLYTVEEDNFGNKRYTKAAIASLDPDLGKVVFASPPSDDVDGIAVDYHYYLNRVDQAQVEYACALYAGLMGVRYLYGRLPSRFTLGRLRIDTDDLGRNLRRDLIAVLDRLKVGATKRAHPTTLDEMM